MGKAAHVACRWRHPAAPAGRRQVAVRDRGSDLALAGRRHTRSCKSGCSPRTATAAGRVSGAWPSVGAARDAKCTARNQVRL